MNNIFFRRLAGAAALTGAIGVIVGAFGAHSLKTRISSESLEVMKTGVQYLFIHVLACIFVVSLGWTDSGSKWLKGTGIFFLTGIVLFSGSLFVIGTSSLTGIEIGYFGMVTPIGGLCFIAGWAGLTLWAFRKGH